MQEYCNAADGKVTLPPGVARHANRRRRGEDVSAGSLCLSGGAVLRPQHIGMAAALGRAEMRVRLPVRVALFSTGDELREPGEPLGAGQVHDINRFALSAMLGRLGCAVTDLGIVRDDRRRVVEALADAASGHELVIGSGGMSVGEEDHVRAAVERVGFGGFLAPRHQAGQARGGWPDRRRALRRIAGKSGGLHGDLRPGGPAADQEDRRRGAGQAKALAGRGRLCPRQTIGPARLPARPPAGRRPGAKFRHDGSHVISSMVEADGLIELHEDITRIEPGDGIDFLPFADLL